MSFVVLNCQVVEWVDIFANPVFKNPGILVIIIIIYFSWGCSLVRQGHVRRPWWLLLYDTHTVIILIILNNNNDDDNNNNNKRKIKQNINKKMWKENWKGRILCQNSFTDMSWSKHVLRLFWHKGKTIGQVKLFTTKDATYFQICTRHAEE